MEKIDDERRTQEVEESQEIGDSTGAGGILRDDVWKHAFHGRYSTGVHSRFMRPLCARYCSGTIFLAPSNVANRYVFVLTACAQRIQKMQKATIAILYIKTLMYLLCM
jgi:hypothetical protein